MHTLQSNASEGYISLKSQKASSHHQIQIKILGLKGKTNYLAGYLQNATADDHLQNK